jgi:uncharacterized 2Fe-2S/4Fe-4S cluster protein (DUF4445 family)
MTAFVTVRFQGPGGGPQAIEVRARAGETIVDAARSARVEIATTCGARGRCRSCRVRIHSGAIAPASVQDVVRLGSEAVREGFRLGCQARLVGDVTVEPMPPEDERGHQILGAGAAQARSGAAHGLDSGVEKILVAIPSTARRGESDHDALLAALPAGTSRQLPLGILRTLHARIREKAGLVSVTTFGERVIDLEAGDTTAHRYGLAVDLGTTTIAASLVDLASGESLASSAALNPQCVHGADVMSRIAFAQAAASHLQQLRAEALGALDEALRDCCEHAKVAPAHVYKIVIVGNPCMVHLLLGIDVASLGTAPYAPVVKDALVVQALQLPLKAAPRAEVCVLPAIAGFVGADTVAGLLATRLHESEGIRALVDVGTNGEVVMGNRDALFACSAPAGPAFEGGQIRQGMRSARGAIERVDGEDDVRCAVIGDVPASGICGSGLIDACARMLHWGVLGRSGRIRTRELSRLPPALAQRVQRGDGEARFVLAWAEEGGEDIVLTQADIRQLQLAKSAVYAAIAMLQAKADAAGDRLERVMLCGGFGNYLDVRSALAIGLLPPIAAQSVVYVGNAALLGAEMALVSETERALAGTIAARVEHVALGGSPAFQELYVQGMGFPVRPAALTRSEVARAAGS